MTGRATHNQFIQCSSINSIYTHARTHTHHRLSFDVVDWNILTELWIVSADSISSRDSSDNTNENLIDGNYYCCLWTLWRKKCRLHTHTPAMYAKHIRCTDKQRLMCARKWNARYNNDSQRAKINNKYLLCSKSSADDVSESYLTLM